MGTDIEAIIAPYKRVVSVVNFQFKTLAIDAMNQIYQFLATIKIGDKPLMAKNGHITSHIQGLTNRLAFYLENGIRPVYIFDGKPNILKQEEIMKRKATKAESQFKASNNDEIEPDSKNYVMPKMTSEMIDDAKKLLDLFGVPHCDASHDGEALAAQLVKSNKAFTVSSQDYDSLLFGANRVVRNLTQTLVRKKGNITVKVDVEFYSLQNILEGLNISQEQLISIGILVGNDFIDGIKGVGPATALELVRKHGTIKEIIAKKNEIIVRGKPLEIDSERAEKAFAIFTEYINTATMRFQYSKPKIDEIKTFLLDLDFNEVRVNSILQHISEKSATTRQTQLENFIRKS